MVVSSEYIEGSSHFDCGIIEFTRLEQDFLHAERQLKTPLNATDHKDT